MRAARSTEFVTPAAALATERVPLPPALSPLERAAWEGMLLIRALLFEQLDGELQLEQRLPLSHHDVLLKLSEAPGGQQRMSELANRVLLTKGGLTRVVDVLEKTGFVERAFRRRRLRPVRQVDARRARQAPSRTPSACAGSARALPRQAERRATALPCGDVARRSFGRPEQTADPAPRRPSPATRR